jgi:DNA topoisomerase-1
MTKNLLIVESPAKAKTIEKFLSEDYTVKSSFGHIRDLPKKGLNIDIAHNFEPKYEISSDKKRVVADLKQAARNRQVWLASDEDREGEAIAWHLTQALGLDPKTTKRIVFHEITKPAITDAIAHPRVVDQQLVDAQQARRTLDRLVGYELSPILWKKVRTGLSAGRVQSVAVRLLVEREREIKDFKPVSSYKVTTIFTDKKGHEVPAELTTKLKDAGQTKEWLNKIKAATFTITRVEKKPGRRSPSPPFTTSTLQQEASRRLGFSVRQTMVLAQRLYEAGHITYMRTDSTNLSDIALHAAADYITKTYGGQYSQTRQYKTKNATAQEAHEAIRPTDLKKTTIRGEQKQQKLYQIIWQRTVASQMAAAKVEKTEVTIDISNQSEQFLAKGEILRFDGFLRVIGGKKEDMILPELESGQNLDTKRITATEVFSRPSARYSEATLVRKLEDLGIGRPSTYAPTISTIQSRGYAEKIDIEGTDRQITELTLEHGTITSKQVTVTTGADRAKLVPTPIAEVVTDFLVKHFSNIVDYDFTARVETDFDQIERGKESWQKMIASFYKDFHPLVKKSEDIPRQEVSQAHLLGHDPKNGEPIYARYGRYGPMLQRGETENKDKKPDFAPMPAGQTIESVTLEQALDMFTLPRIVGTTEDGQEIKANIGRYGPYIQVGQTFVSIKPLDPRTITETEARKLFRDKQAQDAAKSIQEFSSGIKVLNGPYGPYVTDGKKNARINAKQNPAKLTEKQAKELLALHKTKIRRHKQSV